MYCGFSPKEEMVDYCKGKSDSEKLVKDPGLNLELKKWSGVL